MIKTGFKRTVEIIALLAGAACLLGLGGAYGLVKEGNELFSREKYGEALVKYTDAQLASPDDPRLHYNIGTVLHKQKKYDRATDSFRKVISTADDDSLKQKAWYNLGNSYFNRAASAGDVELLKKAVDSYTEALKLDPNDKDAKYNLEVARKMLEMKKKEQKQKRQSSSQQQQKKKKQREGKEEQKGKQKNKGAKKKESPKSTGEKKIKPKGEERKTATEEAQTRKAPRQPKGEMTREEAERLMKAFEEREKRNMRDMQQRRVPGKRAPGGKDW